MPLGRNTRQDRILAIVARNGEVSVETLAREMDVCAMTIRRDLSELSMAGKLSRTHGGAVPSRAGVIEFSFREKESHRAAQKRAIAAKVVDRIEQGMAVSLDTGTTTLEVARAMTALKGVTVLTTSLAIASTLHACEDIDLVLLGGTVAKRKPELLGPLAEENLKRFRVHLAIVGADAVSPAGMFTTDVRVARICRAMIDNADKVILAVDSNKFQQTAFVQYAPLSELDTVVTDEECPKVVRDWLEKAVPEVIYARIET